METLYVYTIQNIQKKENENKTYAIHSRPQTTKKQWGEHDNFLISARKSTFDSYNNDSHANE